VERMAVPRVAALVLQTSEAVVEVRVATMAAAVAKPATSATEAVEVAGEDPTTSVDLARIVRKLADQPRPTRGTGIMSGMLEQEVPVRRPAVPEERLVSLVW